MQQYSAAHTYLQVLLIITIPGRSKVQSFTVVWISHGWYLLKYFNAPLSNSLGARGFNKKSFIRQIGAESSSTIISNFAASTLPSDGWHRFWTRHTRLSPYWNEDLMPEWDMDICPLLLSPVPEKPWSGCLCFTGCCSGRICIENRHMTPSCEWKEQISLDEVELERSI